MSTTPYISVLMPSLNVAEYIQECIQSVTGQTLNEIEIICIDAGSTDGTYEILEEFAKKDDRIKLIRSDKKSYGYQMNLGLDAAIGKYIGIVETDDWIEPDMFEVMWKAAEKTGVDVIKTNHFKYTTKPIKHDVKIENLRLLPYSRVCRPADDYNSFAVTPTIWSAIYSRDMLMKNSIRFHETSGASYQDASFQFMVFSVAESMYCMEECFYHYRTDNDGSSMNSKGKVYCICDEFEYFLDYLKGRPDKLEKLLPVFYREKFRHYSSNYYRVAFEYKKEFLKRMYEEFMPLKGEPMLGRELFASSLCRELDQMLNNPERFYQDTCGKRLYRDEFSNPYRYVSYLIRYAIIYVPRKIRRVMICFSEHGAAYTIDMIVRKLRIR